MTEPKEETTPKQVCAIRIVFPVETDEEAVRYKKAISDILADIPSAFISFSLSNPPSTRDLRVSSPLTPNRDSIQP